MKIHRMTNDLNENGNTTFENVNVKDIREAAVKYGCTDDTLELYDDNNKLIARATWPQGYNHYVYCDDASVGTPWENWHQ